MHIKTTTDQVADHIMKAIYSGKFRPGSKLKEKEIAEWLGVSRTPVREAFRVLESRGLAEINSNKGVRIPIVTAKDLDEVCELRMLLEAFCIKKFVNGVDENQIKEMEEIVEEMEKAAKEKDYLSYFNASIEFHAYYIRKCQNKRAYNAFLIMKNTIQCAQLLFQDTPESFGESINEHKQILELLRKKDVKECEKLLCGHLEANSKRMKESLALANETRGLQI